MSDTKKRYGITKVVWTVNYMLAITLLVISPENLERSLIAIATFPVLYLFLRYPHYAMIRALSKTIYDNNGPKASAESAKLSKENMKYYSIASMLCLIGFMMIPWLTGYLAEALEWVTADERKDLVSRGIGVSYGFLMIAIANQAPKLVDPADVAINAPSWSRSFLRFAGFTGIILGTLIVIDFLIFDPKQAWTIMMGLLAITSVIYFGRFIMLYRDRRKELAAKEIS